MSALDRQHRTASRRRPSAVAARRRRRRGLARDRSEIAAGRARCSASGATARPQRAHGHLSRRDNRRHRGRRASNARNGRFPRSGALHPPAIRLERAIREPLRARGRSARPTRGPGSISASGACSIRLARAAGSGRSRLHFPAGRRRKPAPDPGRPGACRHHRARTFPLHRRSARPWCGWSSGSAMCTRASIR